MIKIDDVKRTMMILRTEGKVHERNLLPFENKGEADTSVLALFEASLYFLTIFILNLSSGVNSLEAWYLAFSTNSTLSPFAS